MAEESKDHIEAYSEWKKRTGSTEREDPKVLFKQVSHIAIYMAYDLIDKLQWWEKETLAQPDSEIEKRIPHMSEFLERLQGAYLEFSDVDL